MAGPYAHITLLHELMNALHMEKSCSLLPAEAVNAVRDHFPFCALGAVSPDIPNLSLDDAGAAWSDAMHYTNSGEMIIRGVRHAAQASADARPRLLAWLLGYCAHVVTDVTIHPVVRIKVGDYAENRRQHRICEMNQDAHVFGRMNLGELRDSDRFARDIVACSESRTRGRLDRAVAGLWDKLLREAHPRLYTCNPPHIQGWFNSFCDMAVMREGQGGKLFPLAALIASGVKRDYPLSEHVDRGFIDNLATPSGSFMHYDDIFQRAVARVCELWSVVGPGIIAGEQEYLTRFGNWDLDTGLDENSRLVFWT
jgi:hypothetical protein